MACSFLCRFLVQFVPPPNSTAQLGLSFILPNSVSKSAMVKGVIGEETRLQLAEDRLSQSGVPVQVGLVIGKLSSALGRGFVFDLLPTTLNDAGELPCPLIGAAKDDKKKGSKAKSTLDSSSPFIDKDWVAEHARQVSRMLVGGVKVIGVYSWVGDAAFKNMRAFLADC